MTDTDELRDSAFNAGWEAARSYATFLDEHGNPPRWDASRKSALERWKRKKR